MAEWYYAKPGPITPIALPGQKVAVWTPPQWTAFKVIYYEPLPRGSPLVQNLGAILAGGNSAVTQLVNFELATTPPEMVQMRFYPLDDIEVNLRRGQSDQRFKTMNLVARVSIFTPQRDPCLHTTEFIILKDEEPWIQGSNLTAYALALARVAFFGYRYILDELKIARPTVEEIERELAPITCVAAGGM